MLIHTHLNSRIRKLRLGSPPPVRSQTTETASRDRFEPVSSTAAEAPEHRMTLGAKVSRGLLLGLSLLGGATGQAVASQMSGTSGIALMGELQQKSKVSDLVHSSVSSRDKITLIRDLSALPSDIVELMVESDLAIKVAYSRGGPVEYGAIDLVNLDTVKSEAASDVVIAMELKSQFADARQLDAQLSEKTNGRWGLYRPKGRRSEMSIRDMAEKHGFKSAADVNWYVEQVYEANSEAFDQVFLRTIGTDLRASEKRGRKGRKAKERLEAVLTEDGRIKESARGDISFINRGLKLAIPNVHKARLGKQKVHVSLHDKQTLDRWTQGSKTFNPLETFHGQYFGQGDDHMILLSHNGMKESSTIIHEVGHAVERLAERNSPEAYYEFFARLSKAHDGIKPSGAGARVDPDRGRHHDHSGRQQISDYSRTNAKEYFAEGFSHYVEDAAKLKKQDPLLHQLVEEGINLAKAASEEEAEVLDLSIGLLTEK